MQVSSTCLPAKSEAFNEGKALKSHVQRQFLFSCDRNLRTDGLALHKSHVLQKRQRVGLNRVQIHGNEFPVCGFGFIYSGKKPFSFSLCGVCVCVCESLSLFAEWKQKSYGSKIALLKVKIALHVFATTSKF